MSPAGGGFPDTYICFLCIRAAQLKPTEKTHLIYQSVETTPPTFPANQSRGQGGHFACDHGTTPAAE